MNYWMIGEAAIQKDLSHCDPQTDHQSYPRSRGFMLLALLSHCLSPLGINFTSADTEGTA